MLDLLLATAAALTIEDYATMPQLSTPRWSPDGTHIAYVVTRADLARSVYEGDVWLVDGDGMHNLQLTREGNDTQPRWSPDGKRIAFSPTAAARIRSTSSTSAEARRGL